MQEPSVKRMRRVRTTGHNSTSEDLSYVADGDTQKEEEVSDVALHFLFDIHKTQCKIRILTAMGRSLEERAFSQWFLSGSSWLPWHLGSVKSPCSWVAALFPVSLPKPHAKLCILLHSPKLLMGEVGRETFPHLEVDTSTVVVVDWFLCIHMYKMFLRRTKTQLLLLFVFHQRRWMWPPELRTTSSHPNPSQLLSTFSHLSLEPFQPLPLCFLSLPAWTPKQSHTTVIRDWQSMTLGRPRWKIHTIVY